MLLAATGVPWWIAGGSALDLFRGASSRPHGDLDVGLLRLDSRGVLDAFSTWEVFEAKGGRLTRLTPGASPRREVHSLWCRRGDGSPWEIELMLDEGDRELWTYRRDPRIQRSMSKAVRLTVDRLPYLAPEIQLLYKSKTPRDRDEIDFRDIQRLLAPEPRAWLRHALELTHTHHHWLPELQRA